MGGVFGVRNVAAAAAVDPREVVPDAFATINLTTT